MLFKGFAMVVGAWIVVSGVLLIAPVYFYKGLQSMRLGNGRPVLIGKMMARHGLGLDRVIAGGLEDELAARARLCEQCADHATCMRRLRESKLPNYLDICPNARFIDGLKTLS